MARKNVKPVQVMSPASGMSFDQILGVYSGIYRTLYAAGVNGEVTVPSPDTRQRPITISDETYESRFDWIIEMAKQASEIDGHLNADTIIGCLNLEALRQQYTVVVVTQPIYSNRPKSGNKSLGGLAQAGIGCVLTVHDCSVCKPEDHMTFCSFLAAHELAHVFEAPSQDRQEMVWDDEDYGRHCLCDCAMLLGPTEKMKIKGTLEKRLFCERCEADIKKYFAG